LEYSLCMANHIGTMAARLESYSINYFDKLNLGTGYVVQQSVRNQFIGIIFGIAMAADSQLMKLLYHSCDSFHVIKKHKSTDK